VLAGIGQQAQEIISEPPFARDVTLQTYGSFPGEELEVGYRLRTE
jgi:hypothetical protein